MSVILPCVVAGVQICLRVKRESHSLSRSRLLVILQISPIREAVIRHCLSENHRRDLLCCRVAFSILSASVYVTLRRRST